MNYIVFDLEWNQCPDGKEKEIKDMPFEIIEIGAVKLDSQRRVIDTFAKNIVPVYIRRFILLCRTLLAQPWVNLLKKDCSTGSCSPTANPTLASPGETLSTAALE